MRIPLIQIDDILVSTDIISEYFCCDYAACKGVCCIIGDSGAPMNIFQGWKGAEGTVGVDEEKEICKAYPGFCHLMGEKGREAVSNSGYSVVDGDGDTVTPLVPGTEECAYCHFDAEGNCMCSIQIAGARKPISCSLYPIRTQVLSNGLLALNLHRWDICKCAFEKGRREGIRVYEFLKEPITAAFGSEFYEALDAARHEL